MWAVVPIRSLEVGKSRLSPVLEAMERRRLVTAMLEDVLAALMAVVREDAALQGVLVVTRDPDAADVARRSGAEVLRENDEGLNAALTQAAHHLTRLGAPGLMVVPGDVPLVRPPELSSVLSTHATPPAVTLVPDDAEEGTNCLLCSPPGLVSFHFGVGSAALHRRAAQGAAAELRELRLPGLGLDIDTPDDLSRLWHCAAARETATWRLARELKLEERLVIQPAVSEGA